jgi:hypothetical protein
MTEQTPMIPPREPYYDDEISISDLVMKLWAKRGLIVMLPLLLALGDMLAVIAALIWPQKS